jgi:tetratricopeptide (TPR) repeat protein
LSRYAEARVYAAEKKWDEAEKALLRVLEIDPKNSAAYALMAESFRARKADPAVAGSVERFVAQRPADEAAAIIGAEFFVAAKNYARAREIYERHLESKPEAAAALNNLANLCSEHLNQPERALELARKARQLGPWSPIVADTLGWILYHRKEYPEALALLEESAKGLPNHAEIQYHLGMVQHALGNKEAAITALTISANAATESPGKHEAKRQLALLEQGR